ncbi:MAG: tRNA (adenosine(37)-N6)-threonylcarbamoyltransferase complex transferase subunit TsaD [Kiritimatiellae bacterium]|nr:tRNA (adenosine(37)-N6)-threonylcarbamoyltransferase complex transferase subunit TsaD [Kiritimatiellia bacterium]
MNILGIETSCDETAAAVVKDGRVVLSNVVYTQIPLHRPYGGVVPEIASRAHVEKISEVINEAIAKFQEVEPDGLIDAIAVTYGPGLSPALIVGLNAAKGLALSLGVPLYCINHIEAHLHTPFLRDYGEESPGSIEARMPALALAISGGHTNWFELSEYGSYELLGQTLDDAAGEAFDKAAKLLNLGYPGGPKIDAIAKAYRAIFGSDTRRWKESLEVFPKGCPREGVSSLAGLPADMCVSFSGLKTALLRYVQKHEELLTPSDDEPRIEYKSGEEVTLELARIVSSYQEAIVGAVADRTRTALRRGEYRSFIIGGGVSLNSRLRESLSQLAEKEGVEFLTAKPKYCGDNGAMIAALAYYRQNLSGDEALSIDVAPSLEIG